MWRIAGVVACALVATACTASSAVDVVISGSSTVQPVSSLVAEAFVERARGVTITVDGPGTGDGFELFCAGETDISDASRPIKDEERERCEAAGVEFVELKIAIDGITVLTSPQNEAVSCLGFADLYALLGPESVGFGRWSDASELASELGAAHGPHPNRTLTVVGPGEESGTYDTFVELVIEDLADERGEDAQTRPDYISSPNDNVIIEGVSGSPGSLGWVGFAFFLEQRDHVKAVEVDGGEGCVPPTAETIADGSYPIARPLFVYVNVDRLDEKPEVVDYVDLYLSDVGLVGAVSAAGYVPIPRAEADEVRATWREVVEELRP